MNTPDPAAPPLPVLLTSLQVATRLGVVKSTIHRRWHRGEIAAAAVVNGQPLFTADAVEAYARGARPLPTK